MPCGRRVSCSICFTPTISLASFTTVPTICTWWLTLDRCQCPLTRPSTLKTGDLSAVIQRLMDASGSLRLVQCCSIQVPFQNSSLTRREIVGTYASSHSRSSWCAMREAPWKLTKRIYTIYHSSTTHALISSRISWTTVVLICLNQCLKCTKCVWCKEPRRLKVTTGPRCWRMVMVHSRTERCSTIETFNYLNNTYS